MPLLRPLIIFSAALLCLASATLAQLNPGHIVGGIQQGAADQEKALEEAMNQQSPKNLDPSTNIPNGWTERKTADGQTVRLYVQHPAIEGSAAPNLPALLVVQEWWGVNDDIQKRTQDFAAKGYYAVAVDLYDGKTTADATEAAALKTALTDAAAQKRLKAGVDFLADLAAKGTVSKARTGVIGWCMGGQQACLLATTDPRIKATVIFYGPLVKDPAELKKIHGPVLGIFGNDDTAPGPADVNAFEKSLKDAKIEVEIHRYDAAGHAFASKSSPDRYKEPQAKDAWDKTWAWLDKNLKQAK